MSDASQTEQRTADLEFASAISAIYDFVLWQVSEKKLFCV